MSELELNDFVVVVNIIDLCVERGSFKGNEIATVGQIREKFAAFIKENAAAEEQSQQAEAIEDETESES